MPPDAQGNPGRYDMSVDERDTALDALTQADFSVSQEHGKQGFGGREAAFTHHISSHGELEYIPHALVHSGISGAMGAPGTAGLDPVFWLHHANIDRLWQVWLNANPLHINPTALTWLTYPFTFHDSSRTPVTLTPAQVLDTRTLLSGYTYEGVAPIGDTSPAVAPAVGINTGLFKTTLSGAFAHFAKAATDIAPEIAAATNDPLLLEGNEASTGLEFLPPTRRSPPLVATAQFAALAAAAPFPGLAEGAAHAYLNFENITGTGVPPVHEVYVGRKGTAGRYAGALPFFGIAESSVPDTRHSGSGQSYVLDISGIAHALEEEPGWDPAQLEVTVRPRRAPRPGSNVRIGRISLYVK